MFYLFINEIPWSTNEQFNEQIGDIEDWERTQEQLTTENPKSKFRKNDDEEEETE